MQLAVDNSADATVLKLPLQPNKNHLGTSFGGSQLSACAIACWLALLKIFEQSGIQAEVVLQKNTSLFRAPVTGDAVIQVESVSESVIAEFIDGLRNSQKCSIEMTAKVYQDQVMKAEYVGLYVAIPIRNS